MTRIENILLRVRDRLNDPGKDRWSDAVLLRLLTDALRDIAVHTKFFYDSTNVDLIYGQAEYSLPDNFYELKAVIYGGQEIPIVSTDYMNYTFGLRWREDTTQQAFTHVVKEHLDAPNLQVYPRPFIENVTEAVSEDDFGITVAVDDYTMHGDFGVIGTVADSMWLDVADDFGVLDAMYSSLVTFTAIYNRQIDDITTVNDILPIGPIFDTALKSYVIAHALLNDMDSENRNAGASELSLYSRELNRIIEQASTNSQPKDSFSVNYNGMG